MAHPNLLKDKYIIDVKKQRWLWLSISAIILIPCIVAMIYSIITYPSHTPIKVGIDFTGGTIIKYDIKTNITTDQMADIRNELIKAGVENPVIQNMSTELKTEEGGVNYLLSVTTPFIEEGANTAQVITDVLNKKLEKADLVSTTSVGPTLGKELLKNSLAALALAFVGIVLYLNLRFKLDYAIIAILALLHDALFVIGVFSIMSLLFNIQIDGLFITAILTVIGFSTHDTIVIFDRIRENNRFLAKKSTFTEIINASINQTMVRSINTSFTTLLTLLALYLFGGATIKDFTLAMILGILIGTYSSIFFATVLLDMWEEKRSQKRA
ncbi:MAG: protein translocase subunit SecF [Cyanobacteria bacterium SIG30]|nr:protein translocase subunit SecF [Cyanobacteria bacterium SIG30]